MKRVGLLGGTFDPPHRGHLSIAKSAIQSLSLDEVWFIPTYEPPHKNKAVTKSSDRVRMLQLMITGEEKLDIHTIEIERKGKSYTIDTINELKKLYPNVQFYFIIGGDQVETLQSWHRINDLLEKVQFVGVERPGYHWKQHSRVKKLIVPNMDVSSTVIRHKIYQGESVKHLIEENVYAYIKEQQLYGYRKGSPTS